MTTMNNMLKWALSQINNFQYSPENWTKVNGATSIVPDFWSGPTSNKIIGLKFPENFGPKLEFDPNKTTVLGGICSLYPAHLSVINETSLQTWRTVVGFEEWLRLWYPRIDQIHNTVGIPSNMCKKIIYICEDSLFARRIYKSTSLKIDEIQQALKSVHNDLGHRAICNWIRSFGYKGEIEVMYTSDIEKELELGLRFWERDLGFSFNNKERDGAKVKLMYTGIWLDILGINDSAIIYEPADHMYLDGFSKLKPWFDKNNYGTGINKNLGIIGFLPFWSQQGMTRSLASGWIPGRDELNFFDFDKYWHVVNFLFSDKKVIHGGPTIIKEEEIIDFVKFLYDKCYK
jgi:hypothetical protein